MLQALAFFLAVASAAPKLDHPAPEFSAKGADGKMHSLKDYKGHIVVLEWFNKGCPFVNKFYKSETMQRLQAEVKKAGVVWLTVASSAKGKEGFLTPAAAQEVEKEWKMQSTALLLDGEGKVARAYAAKTTPHMFVINEKGMLVYEGAIDDQRSADPKSLEGAKNYVRAAIADLNSPSHTVIVKSQEPYGCSVKY